MNQLADGEEVELVYKEDGLEYAQVLCMLGNRQCTATCTDGSRRLCNVSRGMNGIETGDIILVGLRDNDRADIFLKYTLKEARLLRAYGELPENTRLRGEAPPDEGPGV